jgi:hypothetical protein
MKATSAQSLRSQVEKWLAPHFMSSVRVTEFGRTGSGSERYVRVESWDDAGSHALFFFLQDERCWSVFPPQKAEGLKMTTERFAT